MTKITKASLLYKWCLGKDVFNSVQVRDWGLKNFYSRADRTVRDFVGLKMVRRIPVKESRERGLIKKGGALLAWYES